MLPRGVGVGHRPEIATDLLSDPRVVDFVEVVAETCFTQKSARREAAALSAVWPVVAHGVKLSLGSADGLDEGRLGRLASLARELRSPVVSEHVSFTRGGAHEIGHLTALPRTRAALEVVARNVSTARRRLPDVPLLLENVAYTFRFPGDEMDDPTFYQEIVARTGCELLLDVGNLYANALNDGLDPAATLAGFPLDRVAMLHVAGGVSEHGFYFDTHAHPVPEAVYSLVAQCLAVRPETPVLLERDAGFGPFTEIARELHRLREIRPLRREIVAATEASIAALSALQREAAGLLVERDPDLHGPLSRGIGTDAIHRARGVLSRKRVDDALPLLGRLGLRAESLRPLAERVTEATPRPPSGAAPSDAMSIARAAAEVPSLRDDALVDGLLLRARFARGGGGGATRPRRGPFYGSVTLSNGRTLRALKGVGVFADVHLHDSRHSTPINPPEEVPCPHSTASPRR